MILRQQTNGWLLYWCLTWYYLKISFTLAFPIPSKKFPSLIQLTFLYFDCFNVQNITPTAVKVEHFTDLVRTFQLPPILSLTGRQIDVEKLWYSAMDLVEARAKFKVSSSRCLLDLKFNFKYGLLEMPLLVLNNLTEALIQNLMALELFRHGENKYIMDYFYILGFLVNTNKDMDLLCDKGIVVNYLRDNKAATSMVKNLCTNFSWTCMNSDYNNICKALNAFYEKPLHRWKAFLTHEYFSTPLKVASSIPGLWKLLRK